MVGALVSFEFVAGKEEEIGRFFAEGRAIAEKQAASTGWYAVRVGATKYAIFGVFASEADRAALLAASQPALSEAYGHLFAAPPTLDDVEIIEQRTPAAL